MARSHHIYVILRPSVPYPVVAAFTVKRECEIYIRDSKDPWKVTWEVRRFRDGGHVRSEGEENGVLVTFDPSTDVRYNYGDDE